MEFKTAFIGLCIFVIGLILGRLSMAVQVAVMKPKSHVEPKTKDEASAGNANDVNITHENSESVK